MNWDYHLVPALYRIRINHRVEGEDRNCSALLPWKKDPMSAYNATTDLIRSMVPTSSHKIAYRYGTYSNIYIYIYMSYPAFVANPHFWSNFKSPHVGWTHPTCARSSSTKRRALWHVPTSRLGSAENTFLGFNLKRGKTVPQLLLNCVKVNPRSWFDWLRMQSNPLWDIFGGFSVFSSARMPPKRSRKMCKVGPATPGLLHGREGKVQGIREGPSCASCSRSEWW